MSGWRIPRPLGPLGAEQLATLLAGMHFVPRHMQEAVATWFIRRKPVGDFLTALLSNDLRGAVLKADDVNLAALRDWMLFLANHAPAGSFGSPQAVKDWLASGDQLDARPVLDAAS